METVLYFFIKITKKRKTKCSAKRKLYYFDKYINSPENHHPIKFVP